MGWVDVTKVGESSLRMRTGTFGLGSEKMIILVRGGQSQGKAWNGLQGVKKELEERMMRKQE